MVFVTPFAKYFFIAGNKPHMCSICGKTFALQCNLKAHVKLHIQYKSKNTDDTFLEAGTSNHYNSFPHIMYPNPCSAAHQQNLYNHFLNFSFHSLFPLSQKLVIQVNDNKE